MSFKKDSSRSSYIISRDRSSFDRQGKEPEWADDFFANLAKESVHSKKKDISLFEQISSIMNGSPKYSTVDEAVLDMQKRTGLFDYLQKQAQIISQTKPEPKLLKDIPEIKTFINNYVSERPGVHLPAVVEAILQVVEFKNKLIETDIDEDVKKYISDKILESKKMFGDQNQVNMNLGKVDLSDGDDGAKDDPFAGCNPATNGK